MSTESSAPQGRLTRLKSKLAQEMPVTQSLGVSVVGLEGGWLVLGAPLEQNRNHQGTAFAGSVNALATLAGWARVWLALLEAEVAAGLVIQDSSIRYLLPVTSDFTASCAPPDPADLDKLIETVRKHGRGRITMTVSVRVGGRPVAEFVGRYVALGTAGRGRARHAPSR